jgi:hypothetical protein
MMAGIEVEVPKIVVGFRPDRWSYIDPLAL